MFVATPRHGFAALRRDASNKTAVRVGAHRAAWRISLISRCRAFLDGFRGTADVYHEEESVNQRGACNFARAL